MMPRSIEDDEGNGSYPFLSERLTWLLPPFWFDFLLCVVMSLNVDIAL